MTEAKRIPEAKPDVFSRSSQAACSGKYAPSQYNLCDNHITKERN